MLGYLVNHWGYPVPLWGDLPGGRLVSFLLFSEELPGLAASRTLIPRVGCGAALE